MTIIKNLKFGLALIVIYCFLLLGAKCPAKDSIVRGFNTSKGIANAAELAAGNIGALFLTKVISYEMKENLTSKLRLVQSGGHKFHDEVIALAKIYRGKLPDEKIKLLDVLFNKEVIAPFAEIFVQAKVLKPEDYQKLQIAIQVLKNAVFFIAALFGKFVSQSDSFDWYHREVNANV